MGWYIYPKLKRDEFILGIGTTCFRCEKNFKAGDRYYLTTTGTAHAACEESAMAQGLPDDPCAVRGCPNEGRARTCFYDGRPHHHGRIHYDCGYPKHSVEFRKGAWFLICDEHYRLLEGERKAHQNAVG